MRRFELLASAAVALVVVPCTALAQQHTIAANAGAFGKRDSVSGMDLSPDGRHVVYIGPGPGRSSIVVVGDLTTGAAKPILRSTGNPGIARLVRVRDQPANRLPIHRYRR